MPSRSVPALVMPAFSGCILSPLSGRPELAAFKHEAGAVGTGTFAAALIRRSAAPRVADWAFQSRHFRLKMFFRRKTGAAAAPGSPGDGPRITEIVATINETIRTSSEEWGSMSKFRIAAIATVSALALTSAAQAQEKLKIGLLTTLSGPAAALGIQQRNGFELALKTMGNKLGGRDVELIVQDDELKPDVAVSKAKAMVERDKVDFVVGPIFSNILIAMMKPVTASGVFLISPNAGTSNFAGPDCNPNLFVTSYQNDQVHEVLGKYAQDQGMKKVYLIAPNYQAGKDSLAGFKHYFKGAIADEVYVPRGTLDYSGELAKIAAAGPDAIFAFLPGGMGVNFVKQFRQAGLADKIKFLSAFTVY